MAKKIIAGNWKMNMEHAEAILLIKEVANFCEGQDLHLHDTEVIIAPPAIYLQEASKITSSNRRVSIAAQNCSEQDSGAFTGEISANMLKNVGAEAVILGHSERRQFFGDSNELVNLKVKKAIEKGVLPIFCVGEMLEDRKNGKYKELVAEQINAGLKGIHRTEIQQVVVAYEPVWAIGTGETASPEQAQEMHAFIRDLLAENFNSAIAMDISILYGGSVKPENARELFGQPDVDGGLIGGASLKAESFNELIRIGKEVLR